MFKKIVHWLGARAKEPSTYAGLAVVAAGLGFPQAVPLIKAAGLVVGGGLVAHQEPTPAD